MTDSWIIFMYVSTACAIGLFVVLCEVSFRVFAWCFGKVDNHLQDRYWKQFHKEND